MLKNISPLLTPELLKLLCEMGHGDTVVLADAHFPSHSIGSRVVRADGIKIPELLQGLMPLFELDSYTPTPVLMMKATNGDTLDLDYVKCCSRWLGRTPEFIERFEFYEEARKAYVIVHTGETRKYGNIILQKGVIPA